MKLFILIFLHSLIFNTSSSLNLKEGDIVFQVSKSQQSPIIQYATGSIWSHCGIIIEKNNKLYVLEASNVVKLTPLEFWRNRGRLNLMQTKRILNKGVKINYQQYLGKQYDLQFKFNNDKYYCSELVYIIYKNQFNIELCKPKQIKNYNIIGIKKYIKQRQMDLNQFVEAPSDLLCM